MVGKIIAIEGIDGSGKNSQSKLLVQKLNKLGLKSDFLNFPSYEETFFGKEVGNFLNGHFGSINDIHPKLAAILFAGDRWEKAAQIRKTVSQGINLICDRYVWSNIVHQGAKLESEEFETFLRWVEQLEFEIFGVPQSNLNILLKVSPRVANELILKKSLRSYTDKKQDIHEKEYTYLEKVYETYCLIAEKHKWITINCDNESLRSIDSISEELTEKVVSYLKYS